MEFKKMFYRIIKLNKIYYNRLKIINEFLREWGPTINTFGVWND